MPKRLVSSSTSNLKLAEDQSVTPLKPSTIPTTFTDGLPLPSLLVFDLDYTLWPFWVDTHVSAPVKPKDKHTAMVDRWGESFTFYPDVPAILHAARERKIPMSLASRTSAPELAKDMLRGLVIPNPPGSQAEKKNEKEAKAETHFIHPQIFPGNKITHFQRIQAALKKGGKEVAFRDTVFFDDEARNRNVEAELGVTFCLVRDGLTRDEVDRGLMSGEGGEGILRMGGGTVIREFNLAGKSVNRRKVIALMREKKRLVDEEGTPLKTREFSSHEEAAFCSIDEEEILR